MPYIARTNMTSLHDIEIRDGSTPPLWARERAQALAHKLATVNGWKSSAVIASHWAIVLGAGAAAVMSRNVFVYVAAMVVIAMQQQAFAVLVHDGAHHLLYRNRRVNDLVCDLFLAFPGGISTALYRFYHLQHHRNLNTPADPDGAFQNEGAFIFLPAAGRSFRRLSARTLAMLNVREMAHYIRRFMVLANLLRPLDAKPDLPLAVRVEYLVWLAAVVGVCLTFGVLRDAILLFVLPGIVWANVFSRLRGLAEHGEVEGDHELAAARTVTPNWFERAVLAPHGVSYHLEHHLYPFVPGRRLRTLHRALMDDPAYRDQCEVAPSYFAFVRSRLRRQATSS